MRVSAEHDARDRAFALIELSVVTGTFAVLFALLLPAIQQALQ